MASPDIGLGDKYEIVHETVELPKSRADIVQLVKAELNKGGVRKLIIAQDEPVRIIRAVKSASVEARYLHDAPDLDLMASVRNYQIEDAESLFWAFSKVTVQGAIARTILVNTLPGLRKWLKLKATDDVSRVYGVPVRTTPELPGDVLLLVATSEDPEEVLFSVRVVMEMPIQEKKP